MGVETQLRKMREDWDARARANARHFVATASEDWSDEAFFESGRETVRNFILNDMGNICQSRKPSEIAVLEIGCGAGRVTRALSETFGQVYGTDISGEMISRAKLATADRPNVHLFQNDGQTLDVLPDVRIDFAFSYIVFQHIGSREVIDSYVKSVYKVIRGGGLFKFQVQGAAIEEDPESTWVGVGYSEDQAGRMAEANGFEMRFSDGAGSQDYWLWFFRR